MACTNGRDTKYRIFEAAANLFSQRGFNGVSMREIAREVHIKESSIYNHYPSKQAIMDDIIQYYSDNFALTTLTTEEIDQRINTMDIHELFRSLTFSFSPENQKLMLVITRILFIEQFRNEQAKQVAYRCFLLSPTALNRRVIERLIHFKRIPAGVHAQAFGEIIAHIACCMAIQACLEPDYHIKNPIGTSIITRYFEHLSRLFFPVDRLPEGYEMLKWSPEAIAYSQKNHLPQPYGADAFLEMLQADSDSSI